MMSKEEMQRRWSLTRAVMREDGLDWIVCTLGHPFGYAKWLAGRVGLAGTLVAFPVKGDLILATHGDAVHHRPYDSEGVRHIATCAQPNLLANTHAAALIDQIRDCAPKRIGFVGLGYLSAATYATFLKLLPDVDFVDATDSLAAIKAVKSDEELVHMRAAAALHDQAVELVRANVRPGLAPKQIIEVVRSFMCTQGSASQTFMAGSAPPGQPCKYAGPQDRVMEKGDQFAMLIECSDSEGYYSEAMPTLCIGEIPAPLARAHADVLEIQSTLVSMLRPGIQVSELLRVNDEFMVRKGYPPEQRLLGHAQGLDLVERPAATPSGENLVIQKDMVFSVHPTVHAEQAWGFPVNLSFLITNGKAEPMLKTSNTIFVV
ncbi:M24 family metallopeptidase [Pseudomonas sp. Z18(2022)]|uniref:M24 family metallopeptidase n=1 Tax=Pseudomonas sp. Z18(2022) TaxID=2983410 RepID=UPI002E818CA5|nr:M24 family metallopeptidase [Pseudomonas sp. Z18(2022)]